MRRIELAVATALSLLLATALASAAKPASLQDALASLPPNVQQQLRARQARWQALAPAEQLALRRRIEDWDRLPLAQRRALRERWQAWQALPADERAQVRASATAFAALPATEQQQLRARFAALDGSLRHGWLLGPTLGASYAALQPLLQQVPPAQREPLLAALRSMTPGERIDLALLAQRTPPQARDALRRELISTAAGNRQRWLQARLQD